MGAPTALFQGLTPLAVRMRPSSLDEVAGQSHLLRAGSPLVTLANPDAAARLRETFELVGLDNDRLRRAIEERSTGAGA